MCDQTLAGNVAELLESRLRRLERENALWKRTILSILLLIVLTVAVGASRGRRIIEADEFRVTDGGKILARLQANSAGPVLMLGEKGVVGLQATSVGPLLLLGEKGGDRLALAVTKAGPTVSLTDSSGKERAILSLDSSGPKLSFFDSRESETVRLSENEHGSGLTLFHEGKRVASFVVDDTISPAIALSDQDGNPVFIADVKANLPNLELDYPHERGAQLAVTNSGSGFVLFHSNGQPGVGLAINAGSPAFVLFDDHGKDLFKAP
jgi:hypothetical protein